MNALQCLAAIENTLWYYSSFSKIRRVKSDCRTTLKRILSTVQRSHRYNKTPNFSHRAATG